MYLVVIAWIYVALMMAVAEATSPIGTLLGAVFTFVLYGLGPVALVVYLMGTPSRKRRIKEREQAEQAARDRARGQEGPPASGQPDAGGEAAAGAVAPVRKED